MKKTESTTKKNEGHFFTQKKTLEKLCLTADILLLESIIVIEAKEIVSHTTNI